MGVLHFEGGRIIPYIRWERICGEGQCCILGRSWGRMHFEEASVTPSPCGEGYFPVWGRIALYFRG